MENRDNWDFMENINFRKIWKIKVIYAKQLILGYRKTKEQGEKGKL